MSVDISNNIFVTYRPHDLPPYVSNASSMRVSNVVNTDEEQQTNRSCCERVASALRAAVRWLRGVFCCCCKTSDDSDSAPDSESDIDSEPEIDIESQGRTRPRPYPAFDGSEISLSDFGAAGGHPNDGRLEAVTSLDDDEPSHETPPWSKRVNQLTSALLLVISESNRINAQMEKWAAELTSMKRELRQMRPAGADNLSITNLTQRMDILREQRSFHEQQYQDLTAMQMQYESELQELKQQYNLK